MCILIIISILLGQLHIAHTFYYITQCSTIKEAHATAISGRMFAFLWFSKRQVPCLEAHIFHDSMLYRENQQCCSL